MLAPPYRGDLPNADYITYWRRHWKDATTPLMASRGCPFRCTYCVIPQTLTGHTYRKRSIKDVVDEMAFIKEAFPDLGEIFFEFTAIRNNVKVVAIHAASGTEVSVMGPASAARSDLERLALQKLVARLGRERGPK